MAAICTALEGEAELAGYTITATTHGHPLRQWLLDGGSEYQLRSDATTLARHAIAYGAVDWYDDRSAIAVWLAGDRPQRWPVLHANSGLDPDLAYTIRRADLLAALPATTSTTGQLTLVLLAVEPALRRANLGNALLQHRHALLDRAGLAATAYAFDDPTRGLLAAHGYWPVRQDATVSGLPCWTMARPRQAPAAGQEPA